MSNEILANAQAALNRITSDTGIGIPAQTGDIAAVQTALDALEVQIAAPAEAPADLRVSLGEWHPGVAPIMRYEHLLTSDVLDQLRDPFGKVRENDAVLAFVNAGWDVFRTNGADPFAGGTVQITRTEFGVLVECETQVQP